MSSIDFQKIKADFHAQFSINIKKALVVTLVFLNLLVAISPRIKLSVEEVVPPNIIIHVENIPITRQTRMKPPPKKPTVPVPSEDETIPEDVTIEETTLKYTNIFDDSPGVPGITGTNITPPKPIAWVFPEYPKEEKKKGVQGVVKLSIHIDDKGKVVEVVVLDNTTNSEKCAQAAVDAAYGSRFRPAKEGNRAVQFWITQPYRFDIKN